MFNCSLDSLSISHLKGRLYFHDYSFHPITEAEDMDKYKNADFNIFHTLCY